MPTLAQTSAVPTPPADWSRGLVGLGTLRADADRDFVPDRIGQVALVGGRVVAGTGLVRADVAEVYLQDGTGGLRLLLPPGAEPLLTGDSVLVHGVVGHRLGMLEMVAPSVRVIPGPTRRVDARHLRNDPLPGGGRGPDIEAHEGEFVEIEGTVLQIDSTGAGRQIMMLAGSTLVSVFAYRVRANPIQFRGVRAGGYLRVRGVAVQHDLMPPFSGSYVVYPLAEGDVRRIGLPPSTVRALALGAVALLLVALLWAVLLRREVRRRTAALHLSETRYGHLFDAAADPVLLLDASQGGRVLQANHAAQRAFGIDASGTRAPGTPGASRPEAGHALRRPLLLSEIAADPDEVIHHVEATTRRGADTGVLELTRADGRTVPFEFASRRLSAAASGHDGTMLVAVARDVEERRAYELGLLDAMRRSDEARAAAESAATLKATFLDNMSHELRTPLTAILGFADILCEEVPPDLYEYADTVRHGGMRLLTTLNDILDLSRLDASRDAGEAAPFDAVAALRAVAVALAPEAHAAGLALRFGTDAPEATLVQPAEAFTRIATVLVGNAVKFTERGEVRVSLHTAPDFVALRVQDTGVGIGEAFLPDLFEPFTQESGGRNRHFEGNGLGLAVARRLVDRMGGEIRVWSRPGEGTLFEVALPHVAPGATVAELPTAEAINAEPAVAFA